MKIIVFDGLRFEVIWARLEKKKYWTCLGNCLFITFGHSNTVRTNNDFRHWAKRPLEDATQEQKLKSPKSWKLWRINKRIVRELPVISEVHWRVKLSSQGHAGPVFYAHGIAYSWLALKQPKVQRTYLPKKRVNVRRGTASVIFIWRLAPVVRDRQGPLTNQPPDISLTFRPTLVSAYQRTVSGGAMTGG